MICAFLAEPFTHLGAETGCFGMAHNAVTRQAAVGSKAYKNGDASAESVVGICLGSIADSSVALPGCIYCYGFHLCRRCRDVVVEWRQDVSHRVVARLDGSLGNGALGEHVHCSEHSSYGECQTGERQSHVAECRFHAVASFLRVEKRFGRI